jgi:glutaredoxin
MRPFGRLILQAMVVLAVASVAHAQTVYKSIGPDGRVVYSDHPPAHGKIAKTMTFAVLPSSPVPALPKQSSNHSAPSAPPPTPDPSPPETDGVVLYSATWCGYCKGAKIYLAHQGIPYNEIDIDTDNGRAAFDANGHGGVPLLVQGSRSIRGFTAQGYDAFFARQ